jgi:hypothetical protein
MPYKVFRQCTVTIDGKPKRGAKIICGKCSAEKSIGLNTSHGYGEDDDVVERMIASKFEKLGWRIGKQFHLHQCPKCNESLIAEIKAYKEPGNMAQVVAELRKEPVMDNKVVPIQPVEPPRGERPMSRDERRLITEEMLGLYLNETVGYKEDWSDEKVSKKMGVPRVWIAQVRDEAFGPLDINEQSYKVTSEIKELTKELTAAMGQVQSLMVKADLLMQQLTDRLRKQG